MATPAIHKRARAGQLLWEDPTLSQAQALVKAGYSPSTARNPESNELNAQRCIETAQAVGLIPDSASIRSKARRVLGRTLDYLADCPDKALPRRIGSVAKLVDVAERYHGDRVNPDADPQRTVPSRVALLELVAELVAEARQREAKVVQIEGDFTQAEPQP